MEFSHVSVLLKECINGLQIKPQGVYVDCTLGGGGHSLEIARCLSPGGRLIGIDQDKNAIQKASQHLESVKERVTLVRNNFANIKDIFLELGIEKADGFLLDLGVSSHQLDTADRGFSYFQDGPLDMRMDDRKNLSAYQVVNEYSEKNLADVIFKYGEERYSRRIAATIVKRRPLSTTLELVDCIMAAMQAAAKAEKQHPAKRTFQAIRCEVNGELSILDKSLQDMVELLNPGGRLCAISFHSLEDRAVKLGFRAMENPCTCHRDFPVCICNRKPTLKVITRKPILPGPDELENNPRSRSAKLRIGEKL